MDNQLKGYTMKQFTLVTGDVIQYDNHQINPLHAKGEITINSLNEQVFIPQSVKTANELGKLKDNLFNIEKLLHSGYADPYPSIRVLIETTQPLPDITGLNIKRQFNIINFCSADIDKQHCKRVLDALLKLEYVQQIQLDEVIQLRPPAIPEQ